MDHSVLRGADVDASQLVFGGDLAFDELRDLALHFGDFLCHLGSKVLIDLEDLQLDLRGPALRLSGRRDELPALALKSCRVPLKRRNPLDRHEVLPPQVADGFELQGNEFVLAPFAAICPASPCTSSLSCTICSFSCAF